MEETLNQRISALVLRHNQKLAEEIRDIVRDELFNLQKEMESVEFEEGNYTSEMNQWMVAFISNRLKN